MKKSQYYRQMALIDPQYADKYLETAELWAKAEADQDRVDQDFALEKQQVELEEQARLANEAASRTGIDAIVEEYVKPAAAQAAGLSPLVVGSGLMKLPHPAAKVAGGGLLLADALLGLGSNAAAKTDAYLNDQEQPAWAEPTNKDRVMAGALLAMPGLRAISPTLSGVAGAGVGAGFLTEKALATHEQLKNAGLDSGIYDTLAQTVTGPEIREIGMPGNQAVSSLMDMHMLRSGAADLSHSKPVLKFLRSKGLGGLPENIYRKAPTLSGFDSESGKIEVESPDLREHEIGSDGKTHIKSRSLTPEDIDALKEEGFDIRALGAQGKDKVIVNRAEVREAWENKQKLVLDDEETVVDPREFKSLREFHRAVVEHENQHVAGEGETAFQRGARPWSKGGFEVDAGEKPTITVLRRGMKQARFRDEQQNPTEARDWEESAATEEQKASVLADEQAAIAREREAQMLEQERSQRAADSERYLSDVSDKRATLERAYGAYNAARNLQEARKQRAALKEFKQYPPEIQESVKIAWDRQNPKGVLSKWKYARAQKEKTEETLLRMAGRVPSPRRTPEDTIDMWDREDHLNDVLPVNPDRPKDVLQNVVKNNKTMPRPKLFGIKRDEGAPGLKWSMKEFDEAAETAPSVQEHESDTGNGITFRQHSDPSYTGRTRENAKIAPVTVDFARTPRGSGGTSGLTKIATDQAGNKHVWAQVEADGRFDVQKTAESIFSQIAKHASKLKEGWELNVAGHGLRDLKIKQTAIDDAVHDTLSLVRKKLIDNKLPAFGKVRSGGQTGFDEAGAKSGAKMGLPTEVLAPKGWLFRDRGDVRDETAFKKRFGVGPHQKKTFKGKILDQWNSKEYGRQLEREEYETAKKDQYAKDQASREEDGLGKGYNPNEKYRGGEGEDATYSDFMHAVRSGNISERDLPSDYPTLKAIARKTGLGKIEYTSGEEATKSATMKERILAALDDMTHKQILDLFERDTEKIYLPYSKNGNFPKDAVDIFSARLRNGQDVVLTTNSVHQGIHAKLTWDAKTREPVYDNQIFVAHDPTTLLAKDSKMRYISTDHVTLTDDKYAAKLAEFDTLGEFVDWAAKQGIAKPFKRDAKGKVIPVNSEAADQIARAMAQHETAGESVRRPMFVDNRHYSPSEIARAIIGKTALSKKIKAQDPDLWMEYALEAVQGRSAQEIGLTGKIQTKGPGAHEEKALDSFIKSKKKLNPELIQVKNEMEIRKAFVQAKGCTPEEAGFYMDEYGNIKFMGDSLWSVKEMQKFVKENPPQKSDKTGGDRGFVDTTGEAEREAHAAEFGADYVPETSEVTGWVKAGSARRGFSSPSMWWKIAKNTEGKSPAQLANVVARLDRELESVNLRLKSEGKAKIVKALADSALDPFSKAEKIADAFTTKWQYARAQKGEKKQTWAAWGFMKMVDIASAASTSLMSMLSGREFMIHAMNKAVDALDTISVRDAKGEATTLAKKMFTWTQGFEKNDSREKWDLLRYSWEVLASKQDALSEKWFEKVVSPKGQVEYKASIIGIRDSIRTMVAEAVGRSREVDEMVRGTNILSLRRKLADDDKAITNFGEYLMNRDKITSESLTKDQRAFLEAGVQLHDGVGKFMKILDPKWKERQNYVTQVLKDFDTDLVHDVQKLNTAEKFTLANRLKTEMGIGKPEEDIIGAKYKYPELHAKIYDYMDKVRRAIREDPRNGGGEEITNADGSTENSLSTTINQLLEYKLNQLFGTGTKTEGKEEMYKMIGNPGQGPTALFSRKLFGYGNMQETHADILVQRLVQSAHKNYPYHDLYRAMAVFVDQELCPPTLISAMNSALPDGFSRIQRWSTSAIQNSFMSGLTGDVKRPTTFSKFTDYLMGTMTSYDPHPNNAAAHYWTSVLYRNLLTRPEFFAMNATDPLIKTSFDGNFWQWASAVSRVYPLAIKEALYARVSGKSSKLLAEAYKHIRAKGNVATELSGANLPSAQGAVFGKLGKAGILAQKGWGKLTGMTEIQEHFNTAAIWLIEAEKLLQLQLPKADALIQKHGSLVQAAIDGAVHERLWSKIVGEATLRAEQRQGVGSDFMGKSEIMENFTATTGKNHPAMALAIFARMFQNYPATIIAQLAKATNTELGQLRGKLETADTSSLTGIMKSASPQILKAVSPTALMMIATVLSYQGGRTLLTGELTSSDYKEKDRKKQLKSVWAKLANIVGESGRLATKDLGIYQSMIPASIMKNIMLLASDPKTGANGLAGMFIPGVFSGQSVMRDAPKLWFLKDKFKKEKR